jgi:hypothetical protein
MSFIANIVPATMSRGYTHQKSMVLKSFVSIDAGQIGGNTIK